MAVKCLSIQFCSTAWLGADKTLILTRMALSDLVSIKIDTGFLISYLWVEFIPLDTTRSALEGYL
jgi:hypothetical protein